MSGALIEIKVNDKEVQDLLNRLQSRTGDLKPAMKIAGEVIKNSVLENFRQGGRPQKWQPLAASTIMGRLRGSDWTKKGKIRKGTERRLQGRKILIGQGMHGGLMDSITSEASADRVVIGTNKKYAALHQFGGPAGRLNHRVNIPARPYLMVQDEDWERIKYAIMGYLLNK